MPEHGRVRVVLVDDHEMVRQGLAQLMKDSGQVEVIGEASNGLEGVELAVRLAPDVVVLDYTMPVMGGLTAIEEIRRRCPRTRILMLTVHENVHYAARALEAGAQGFVIKLAAVQELLQGIAAVHAGKVYVSPSISEQMLAGMAAGKTARSGLSSLSRREFELLRLLAGGAALHDCAKAMKIKPSTASAYRARLLQKLGLRTTAEVIRFALENNISG